MSEPLVVNGLRLTPGRVAWLRVLAQSPGGARRPRGQVGRSCMMAGFTTWLYTVDGTPVDYELLPERSTTKGLRCEGEILTSLGREVVRRLEARDAQEAV